VADLPNRTTASGCTRTTPVVVVARPWAHTGVVEREAGPENVVGMVLHAFGRSLLEDPLVTVAWMLLVSLAGVLGVLLVAIGVELVGRL
jgi:hypothetical protein